MDFYFDSIKKGFMQLWSFEIIRTAVQYQAGKYIRNSGVNNYKKNYFAILTSAVDGLELPVSRGDSKFEKMKYVKQEYENELHSLLSSADTSREVKLLEPEALSSKLVVSIAAHSNSISVGLTQGYSAVLLPQLTDPLSTVLVNAEEASWIASLGVISTPFGALLSGIIVDFLGRKLTILITSLPFLIGWVLTAFARDVSLLYIGRAISGFATGMTTVSFLYIAEVSSKENRSMLSSLGSIAVSFGVLIVYTLGFVTTWQKAALIASSFSVLTVLVMLRVPESPSWLVSRNQINEAKNALRWLRPDALSADLELSALLNTKLEVDQSGSSEKSEEKPVKKVLHKVKKHATAVLLPTVYKPFIILTVFFIFQEGSGIYIFLFYSNQIFKEFGTEYDENLISVSTGTFRLLMSVLGALLMAKIGRRPLALFSGGCMSISLLTVSIYQFICDNNPQSYDFLPFVCVLFYVGFSMTGFLQLPWILTSELFPADHRGLFSGIISSLGYLFIFITVKIYPDLLGILKLQGLLWGFFIMTCIGTLFVYFFLPETKDKSLKEISMGFMNNKCADAEKGKAKGTEE